MPKLDNVYRDCAFCNSEEKVYKAPKSFLEKNWKRLLTAETALVLFGAIFMNKQAIKQVLDTHEETQICERNLLEAKNEIKLQQGRIDTVQKQHSVIYDYTKNYNTTKASNDGQQTTTDTNKRIVIGINPGESLLDYIDRMEDDISYLMPKKTEEGPNINKSRILCIARAVSNRIAMGYFVEKYSSAQALADCGGYELASTQCFTKLRPDSAWNYKYNTLAQAEVADCDKDAVVALSK